MKEEIKKFLEFNGKVIHFLSVDGQYWIAIKPICRALGVDYIRQFKNLKADAILAPAYAVQPMQTPDKQNSISIPALSVQTTQVPKNQLRNYLCLPNFLSMAG